ncbi:uncharacterized protein [Littorina saxatilis]|uniref:uncharacterized protein n=1 Tax=Littorina saxatilis TaxID=31220 RepID=UPI0038B484C6
MKMCSPRSYFIFSCRRFSRLRTSVILHRFVLPIFFPRKVWNMLISTYLLVHLLSTMCDPAPSAENAEENTAEPSSSAKYNLRIKLKRPVNCSYEEDEEDEGDGEMRIRLACELALNAEFYLSDASLSVGLQAGKPYTKFYATYTPQYTMQVLTPAVIREIYEGEVLQWTKNGTYAGMWELHALSSVLGTTIHSIYPQYGGFNVRPHLHRIVHPRRPAVPPNFVPGVMWTSTHGTAAAANVWAPNHFVACLPRAADGLNSTSSSFIPQLKPGDFIKVKVPKKNGSAVIYMAQVTQKEGGVISGRYLKPWGAAWKFSDALSFVEEYQIPLQDIAEKMDSAVLHDDGRNIYYTF